MTPIIQSLSQQVGHEEDLVEDTPLRSAGGAVNVAGTSSLISGSPSRPATTSNQFQNMMGTPPRHGSPPPQLGENKRQFAHSFSR